MGNWPWSNSTLKEQSQPHMDIFWFIEGEDIEIIKSKPDFEDQRFRPGCDRCGESIKKVYSFLKADRAGLGRKEAHYLYCWGCNQKICELPHAFSKEQAAGWVFPFGKHKGKALRDVPRDYLGWCVKNLEDQKVVRKISFFLD